MNRVLIKKIMRDIRHRKGSLLALVVIMGIGVGTFSGFMGTFRDMDGARADYYATYRLANFYVDVKRVPAQAVDDLRNEPNIESVRGRVNFPVLIDLENRIEPASGLVISMPLNRAPVINDLLLKSGTWFTDAEHGEVILDAAFASANGLKPGNRIKVTLLDRQHELLVVGTAMSPEFVYLLPPSDRIVPDPKFFGVMYLPVTFLQNTCDLRGAFNQVIGMARNTSPTHVDNTLNLIERKLDAYGVTNTTAARNAPSVRFLADELNGLKVSASVVPMIFLGVAALVLNVLINRLVAQERVIIGTLKAIGYSTRTIAGLYMIFALVVGLAGGLVGSVMGMGLQSSYDTIYMTIYALPTIPFHFHPDLFFAGMMISTLFALAGAGWAVRAVAKLAPAVAMKPPAPKQGHRLIIERIPRLWNRLTFQWKLILRSIFRSPFRSGVRIVSAMVSTALIITTMSLVDSLNYLTSYQFEKIAHQDITLSLRDPIDESGLAEIRNAPTVSMIEPEMNVPCDFINGPYRKRMGIIGMTNTNRLSTPLDGAGNPVRVPPEGVVLSKKLAEILHVNAGETVRIRTLIGLRRDVAAPVTGIVETFLGLAAYADKAYLGRMIGESDSANTVLCKTYAGADRNAFMKAMKDKPKVIGISERIRALTQIDETFGKTMGTLIGVMVFFSGLIAFGSVLNAMLVTLSEREREIGTMRVLGFGNAQIAWIFSRESFLLNTLGVGLGIFAGIGLAYATAMMYNTELYRYPVVIRAGTLATAVTLMAGFVLAAQAIIFRMIWKMNWLDALKTRE